MKVCATEQAKEIRESSAILTLLFEIFKATVLGGSGVGKDDSWRPEQFTITDDTTGLPGTISIRRGLQVQFCMHCLFSCNFKQQTRSGVNQRMLSQITSRKNSKFWSDNSTEESNQSNVFSVVQNVLLACRNCSDLVLARSSLKLLHDKFLLSTRRQFNR